MFKSTVLGLIGVANAALVWEDQFDKLDFGNWAHEITLGGGGNWEFEWYVNNRTNSYVDEGVLHLQPTLTSDQIDADYMWSSTAFDIWGGEFGNQCTSNAFYGCSRAPAYSGQVLNPVKSARMRTAGKFSFGINHKVEIRAQLPKGDWIWPAIWLLPENEEFGPWPASGEIDIMESRGNDDSCSVGGRDTFGSTLHWGIDYAHNQYEKTTQSYTHTSDLSDDFHIYGLMWTDDGLYTYIDTPDNKVLNLDFTSESFWERAGFDAYGFDNPWRNEPNAAPFNRNFFLILNVAVGGTEGYFPDGECGRTWNDVNDFYNQ
jgi:hypothetical protein